MLYGIIAGQLVKDILSSPAAGHRFLSNLKFPVGRFYRGNKLPAYLPL